jgi:taurine dioxygenase
MISIERITPRIGAELKGINFSNSLTQDTFNEVYQALIEHLVIFIRNTSISAQQYLEFAKSFGELDTPHPVYPSVEGFEQIVKLENDAENPPDTDAWHTDLTFKKEQPFASILVARAVPKVGGDTLWSSCYAAYDRLPEGMKRDFEAIQCIHDMGDFRNTFSTNNEEKTGEERLNIEVANFGHSIRNLVETHPVTGKKFLNFNESFVSHIVGLTMNDSNSLKTFLTNHMNKPEDQIRWRWKEGDLVMWDNRITMHYAVADYLPAHRCMHRITVVKDKRASSS